MRYAKVVLAILLIFTLSLSLVACGGSPAGGGGSSQSSNEGSSGSSSSGGGGSSQNDDEEASSIDLWQAVDGIYIVDGEDMFQWIGQVVNTIVGDENKATDVFFGYSYDDIGDEYTFKLVVGFSGNGNYLKELQELLKGKGYSIDADDESLDAEKDEGGYHYSIEAYYYTDDKEGGITFRAVSKNSFPVSVNISGILTLPWDMSKFEKVIQTAIGRKPAYLNVEHGSADVLFELYDQNQLKLRYELKDPSLTKEQMEALKKAVAKLLGTSPSDDMIGSYGKDIKSVQVIFDAENHEIKVYLYTTEEF